MIMPILYSVALIISFIVLWIASDRTVIYASQAAHLFGFSDLFIAFVLLSFFTGLPELLIAIQSLWLGTPMLSVGDVVGSNLVNITLALGIPAAFINPIKIDADLHKKQLVMLIITILIMAFVFTNGHITHQTGIILLLIYIGGIFWFWKMSILDEHPKSIKKHLGKITKTSALIRLMGALIFVVVSSKLCITMALHLAQYFEISEGIIGVSIVAAGTSLPEISLNMQAVRAKHYSIAIGNSLGSVFGQGALSLGILATLAKQPLILTHLYAIIPFMAVAYLIIIIHLTTRKSITRLSGLFLLALHAGFIAYEFLAASGAIS